MPSEAREPMPLRRLTRAEYTNTVRDLFKLPAGRAFALPPDERVGLFPSNLAGTTSWSMLELYAQPAEALTETPQLALAAVAPCDAAALGEGPCAERFIEAFGLKAYRRPLTAQERERYQGLYQSHAAAGGAAKGLRWVARAMLQSPHFLYHLEESGPEPTQFELASRLSYFLWGSMPDDALLAAASAGALATAAQRAAQVDRLLADDRARETLGQFHLQLLGVEAGAVPNKSPAAHPGFGAPAWRAMVEETVRFADHVVRRGDGRLRTLLTAAYGIDAQGARVALDPARSAGLLTHPSVLAGLANPDTTSPVRRGVMIRRNLMCQALPDPPPEVNTTVAPSAEVETTRQRVTRVTSASSSCAGCHGFINDVGFGFEHYDAVGAYRERDNGLPIDASGTLSGTTSSNGAFDGAPALAARLAQAPEVEDCYARQWVHFALGRAPQPVDRCEVAELSARFRASGGDVRGLLRGIALSAAFSKSNPQGTP